MTLGAVTEAGGCFCSCCGAKMMPYFSDDSVVSQNQINQLISESFLTVKGAALFLPRGNSPTPNSTPRISQRRNKHTGDLRQHLQTMFTLLRPEDTIRLAVRLENAFPQCTRYMVVVSTNGRQDTEESIVLGMDFSSSDSCCTLGLVLPLWSNTLIHLDGDGGFSVSTVNRVHVFKPVSVQAMWSALQSLHKACEVARCHNYYPGSLFLTWVSYYQSRVSSDQICINEWNAMQDVQSHRADSPVLFTDVPTERERTERLIKTRLREIMMQKDLENVTCKEIRTELEMQMVCNLREFKEFIDNEMIVILGQMDSPTEIFDHVYLGSEWNASNLDELQNSGVCYILNVTREIDNFFPGIFEYQNIRVYDEEATNLLEYWNDTYKFISKAKKAGAKCLVHCKMGVSRSASTVIAYAMKEYGWDLDTAFDYVKQRRAVAKPNPAFMKQLEEYQGILLASKQRHNKLWRSHSDGDLSDRPDLLCKPTSHSLGRSDPRNNNNISSPSLHHFLGVAVLQALGAEPRGPARDLQGHSNGLCDSPELLAEDPLLRPAPRPRAATAIPVERVDTPPKVAVALPAAVPHPPPSVHVLPPPSEPQLSQRTAAGLSLDLPERRVSEDLVSPLILGSSDSDTLEYSLSDSPSTGASPATPLRDSPNDHNNNPSDPVAPAAGALDGCGEADGLSNHSADSIDFFSAREKFLGLAQDGWTRTVSEQASQRTPFSPSPEDPSETKAEEEQHKETNETPPPAQGNADEASLDKIHHHDNGISVRHIVTEIESISHPPAALSPTSSSPPSLPVPCRSLQAALHPPQQEEDRETGEVTHAPMTPPPHPQSPSAEPCDWPAGSVRRATEQLEQRLKQELSPPHAAPRSPPHSPSGEPPAPLPPGADPPAHPQRLTQGENAPPPFSTVPKDTEGPAEHPRPSGSATPTVHSPNSSFSPHSSPQLQSLPSLGVEGVTAQESDTDHVAPPPPAPCGAACDAQRRLVHSSQELQRIQRTLRELQAFLHEGIAPEAEGAPLRPQQRPAASGGEAMDTEPERGEEAGGRERQGKSLREPAWWSRAIALEARIRQAGLTPPSLMKRSASLAKLDRLELSADDLSDWDLCPPHHPHPSRPPPSAPHGSPRRPDDVWKKQRVLARPPRAGSPGPPSDREEETGEKEEAPARRGPSTRRARKSSMEKNQWSVAALYNTM